MNNKKRTREETVVATLIHSRNIKISGLSISRFYDVSEETSKRRNRTDLALLKRAK
jgi:hypothetical protein